MKTAPAAPARTLQRGALGPLAIAFFVISAAGPLVAMAGGIPVAMLFGNGPGLPAMFALATAILLVFAVSYTAMAREVPHTGAFYAFAARGLGGRAAGATGMIALLSYNALQIGLYGLFGAAMQGMLEPVIGVHLPWWTYALLAMVSIGWLGYRRVDLSAKILGLLVAAEYGVVILLDVVVVQAGAAQGLSAAPFGLHAALGGAPAIGLMMCFTAFVGFEATTIYSEEARDPNRTIPLATYCSVLLIGGFYTLSTWAVVIGVGPDHLIERLRQLPDPTELLFSLAHQYAGTSLPLAMRVLFVTSIYASLLAFHNAIARYFFAMGREGVLPARLGQVHPSHASPHVGSMAQSLVAAATIILFASGGFDPVLVVFTLPSAVATLGIIAMMASASLATLCYFARTPHPRRSVQLSAAISLIAFLGVAGLATTHFEVLAGAGLTLSWLLPALLPTAALIGVLLAWRPRAQISTECVL